MPRRPPDDDPHADLPPAVRDALLNGSLADKAAAVMGLLPPGLFPAPQPTLLPPRRGVVTYRVRVDLDDVRPPIWRRLEVPSDVRLDAFHDVLQTAMGWTNSHLHAFRRRLTGPADRFEPQLLTAFDVAEGEQGAAEADVRLDQVLGEPGDRLLYTYDFGDGWNHTVKLEAVTPARDDPRPRCVAGRRACPPEDCGGPWGYQSLLDLRAEQRAGRALDEDDRERLAYYELDDPERFSVQETDEALAAGPTGPLFPDDVTGRLDTTGLPAALVAILPRISPGLAERLVALAREAVPHQHLTGVPQEGTAARQTAGIRWLLDQVGDDGVVLTQAGYLPPTVVAAAFDALSIDPLWRGRAARPRESDVVPLALLRSALQDLGLLRKYRGRLRLTKAGQRVRHDPLALLQHVAGKLPAGSAEYERVAGLVLLLGIAAGRPVHAQRDVALAVEVLHQLGWARTDGPLRSADVHEAGRTTAEVLVQLGAVTTAPAAGTGAQPPEVVALARLSLTGG
ncbi:plasmid pRiA4b ORF-3 family protein [Kineococcus sp. SYSU DK018]|uniref:plasmid pRiA4b ORF-3 family protein n=1 Tax=Kineococcus sp. SYSU DK018 TaxID=3383139 RepID=UPI003D7D1713